jgi:signal transduction histidine kinase/AraC-like DNA-binding protein
MPNKRIVFIVFALLLILRVPAQSGDTTLVIGFSQCTTADLWRETMHREMMVELMLYPQMQLLMTDAESSSEKQIADIKTLVAAGIDLLIISPNEAAPLTHIAEEVYKSGIPVVIVDRKIESDNYTAYVGADNYLIGHEAGQYAVKLLKGAGNIVEITGLQGSSPAQDRQRGFLDAIENYPDIRVIFSGSGRWNYNGGVEMMQQALTTRKDIDLVFAHNDVMAAGAYQIIEMAGLNNKAHIIGIDGLAGSHGGLQYVIDGKLDATLLYPTGGETVIQLASQILKGKSYQKDNILQTVLIDSANAHVIKAQTEYILSLQKKVETQTEHLNLESEKLENQQLRFLLALGALALILLLAALLLWAFQMKRKANLQLAMQNKAIEQQKQEMMLQNEKLKEVSQQLMEATSAKLQFFTNISHEFRTPLTLILGPLENLLRSMQLTPGQQHQLVMIQRNAMRLLRLINQLMDFRKLENQKMKLNAAKYDLATFLKETYDNFSELARKKAIDFNFVSTVPKMEVWFDSDKLDKIMFNLLSNAFKFTPSGGKIMLSLSESVMPQTDNNVAAAEIEITDTGRGISAEHLQRIFERFYQGEATGAIAIQGTGIGLSLTKGLIDLHHGQIEVESEKQKGTTIRVFLPLGNNHLTQEEMIEPRDDDRKSDMQIRSIRPETDILPDFANEYTSEPPHFSTQGTLHEATIFVVEDNEDVRQYIRNSLPPEYSIHEAENGEQGLQLLEQVPPDLIISDVMMPVMDGLEMTRRIKSDIKYCHIPIILLTAKASLEHKLEGLEIGADSYIPKPFNSRHLQIRVQKLIENRQRIRQHYRQSLSFDDDLPAVSNLDKNFLNKALKIINHNLADTDFGVEELSREIGMSRVHLYRKIKQLTGLTVSEFIRSVRLKKAMLLLTDSGLNVNEAAMATGFATPSYFAKCFKEQFKILPSDVLKK